MERRPGSPINTGQQAPNAPRPRVLGGGGEEAGREGRGVRFWVRCVVKRFPHVRNSLSVYPSLFFPHTFPPLPSPFPHRISKQLGPMAIRCAPGREQRSRRRVPGRAIPELSIELVDIRGWRGGGMAAVAWLFMHIGPLRKERERERIKKAS